MSTVVELPHSAAPYAAISSIEHSPPEVGYSVQLLQSAEELLDCAEAWDDLWQRSAIAAPSLRAALIAGWLEHFATRTRFCAVVVTQGSEMVAALPLVGARAGGVLDLAGMPSNGWSVSGDLLLDEASVTNEVLDVLVDAIQHIGWPALWLDQVPFEEPRWRAFCHALERAEIPVCIREHFRIGQVRMADTWQQYEETLDGDHRRSRQRYSRMLEKAATTQLNVMNGLAVSEVASLIKQGFEVEDRSWKSSSGTSVLKTSGILDFYIRQAEQLAEWNQLELVSLEHGGRVIAFDYGWKAKATHFLCKLGYDDEFRKYGPGQQMVLRLLRKFHDEGSHDVLDFWGPLVPWNDSWSTHSYPVGRLVAPLSPVVGRSLFHAYKNWQPKLRRLQSYWQRMSPVEQ